MNTQQRTRIQRTLQELVTANSLATKALDRATRLLADELALDPMAFWELKSATPMHTSHHQHPRVDMAILSVVFDGHTCFLGNTLPLRLFAYLLRTPNAYISYEDLLNDVWDTVVTDSAIRSVVKCLRAKLRMAGMVDLANAIDGSERRRYVLRIPSSA